MAADAAPEKATRKTNDVGPTGQTVARNLARIRNARGLSTYQLSDLLREKGRPIAPSAVSRIESGVRKVDVDDLVAIAIALRVSPTALLMPPTADPDEAVNITGEGEISADVAWEWTLGERPLAIPADDDGEVFNDFQTMSRPPGRRNYRVTVKASETATRVLDTLARTRRPPLPGQPE